MSNTMVAKLLSEVCQVQQITRYARDAVSTASCKYAQIIYLHANLYEFVLHSDT